MNNRIHFFSHIDVINKKIEREKLGIRGRQANEFAELGFPILPGIILDTDIASEIEPAEIKRDIVVLLNKCAGIVGKKYGDPENPMLVKVVISSNMAITNYPVLHNFGLVRNTIDGFAGRVGKDFAVHELLFLIRGMLRIEDRLKELEGRKKERSGISARLKILDRTLDRISDRKKGVEAYMDEYDEFLPQGFFDNAERQLLLALGEISRMLGMDDQKDSAIIISPMVYGNYDKDSCYGTFFSRDVITGEKKLQGKFFRGNFNEIGAEGRDIGKIGDSHLKELQKIAWTMEDRFKEIRQVLFTIENGRLWLIKQGQVDRKSTRADIKLLLDLANRRIVNNAWVVNAMDPPRLAELIHPVVDPASVRNMKSWTGGIAGAPGAAIGRVYFSTGSLLEARKLARKKGQDTRTILAAASSFAEDVKAIEVSSGVLTAEGGYSAHASVVARQYGKVSIVAPDLCIKGKKATLGSLRFSEGDYITLDVPFYAPSYGTSSVYLGSASLIEPDPVGSGLLDFIDLSKGFLKDFHVRCNADSPRDAALGLSFGADGVGLCRTEHMFFGAERIQVFRGMLLSTNVKEREKALAKLRAMQREDFCGIFRVMAGKEVTIRLLDSPLHEFMPHNEEELAAYMAYARKAGKSSRGSPGKAEVLARIDALHEFNPMLGHRGCRLAVSHPEIYAMQIKAIFEAAWKTRKEGIEVRLEIMVPIVMNASELKLIAYGKKIEGTNYRGIVDIEEEFRSELRSERNSELRAAVKAKGVDYKIGAMIELPAAALGAAEIARYAAFFSFGTNDLTQATLGISRDDFTSFMGDYTLYDLIRGNPFSELDPRVRELISIAAARGRLTRPDLILGLCGEHGANPANVRFCMEAGLDYVSCSPYAVPIAILAAAQAELDTALT